MDLLFVYNANTDIKSAVFDYAHKVFSPSTYQCELCALTHHNLGERKAWKRFKKRTDVTMEFWYIKQFEGEFNMRFDYPVVLRKREDGLHLFMSKAELQQLESVEELIGVLEQRTKRRKAS